MFNFCLSINNPWAKNNFKNLFNRNIMVSKFKAVEFEIIRHNYIVVNANVRYTTHQDHAGSNLTLGLFGYEVIVSMYDTRHWNYSEHMWHLYADLDD